MYHIRKPVIIKYDFLIIFESCTLLGLSKKVKTKFKSREILYKFSEI